MSKNIFIGTLFDGEEEEDFDGQSFLPCTVDEFRAAQEDYEYDGEDTLDDFFEKNEVESEVAEAIRNAAVVCFGKSDKLGLTWVEVGTYVGDDPANDEDPHRAEADDFAGEDDGFGDADEEYEFASYIFAKA